MNNRSRKHLRVTEAERELDARWAQAVKTAWAGIVSEASREPVPAVCCCPPPLMHEGQLYTRIDAGCRQHGIRSRWMGSTANQVPGQYASPADDVVTKAKRGYPNA